uniref:Glutathione S-transferase 968 n=1 Tax=Ectropis obliqua TaxID=248899 RepID=A0A7T0M887_ECTOB|nr:glutathione S-transferase 968 [Ectropis obliqua]
MAPTLYYTDGSPPCHRVFLTANILKVDLNLKSMDFFKQEHKSPEFLKLNPQHTVPTLVDGALVVWESRAICRYLVNQYGAGSSLYPAEPAARAGVDQRLDFDYGLYETFGDYYYSPLMGGPPGTPEKLKKVQDALEFLNTFLGGSKYVAGEQFTIADCALVSTVAVIELANVLDLKAYPNVLRWYGLVKTSVPEYPEAIEKNIVILKQFIDEMTKKS